MLPTPDIRKTTAAIDAHLAAVVHTLDLPLNLKEAIAYAALGGGKRIRPLLAWHSCVAVGAPGERSLSAGAAVEFIHAFSLVHDDLPALDNDDLRRGKPTLHIHAGEAMAILAGDALMALAFDVLDRHSPDPALTPALIAELSSATMGMIAGQVFDTLGGLPAGLSDRERLERIHRNKTGALIRAACRMGAVLGTGRAAPDDSRLRAITRYAECVGLLFQIVDDLLDVESSPEQTGKRTRKDVDAGKVTYPSLLGVEGSRREVARLHAEALAAIGPLGPPADGLRALTTTLTERRS